MSRTKNVFAMKKKKNIFPSFKRTLFPTKKNKIAKNVSDITFKDFCDKKKAYFLFSFSRA